MRKGVGLIDKSDNCATTAAAATLAAEGFSVEPVGLDVTDRGAVTALIERLGEIRVVVNNAGIAARLDGIATVPMADWRRVFAVNVQGMFIVAQAAARRMTAGGRIINIASRGYLGGAGAPHYVASKAAVVGLTRAMAIELRWAGITVNAVAPGMVETRMIADYTPQMRTALLTREPAGAPADPDAIAAVVAFLAGSDASFVTGQVLLADGGKSLGMPLL